jgi:hypothetical protein
MSYESNEAMTERIVIRRRVGWRSRWFETILADVKGVDSGSLDVLLYCADDLSVHGAERLEVERPRRRAVSAGAAASPNSGQDVLQRAHNLGVELRSRTFP